MKSLTLIFLLCAALLLAACGGSSNQANGGGSAGGTAAGVTGIAACDEYIAKVEKCMNSSKVPEQAKAMYKQSLEQYRAAWKQAASRPESKAALEPQCKTILQQAAAGLDACQ